MHQTDEPTSHTAVRGVIHLSPLPYVREQLLHRGYSKGRREEGPRDAVRDRTVALHEIHGSSRIATGHPPDELLIGSDHPL
jgi:hypothetical protein